MGGALSISLRKLSPGVFIDHATRAFGKLLMRSRPRKIRSLLVAMLIFAPLPASSKSRARVRLWSASCGR